MKWISQLHNSASAIIVTMLQHFREWLRGHGVSVKKTE
jgi:hypothetical protein